MKKEYTNMQISSLQIESEGTLLNSSIHVQKMTVEVDEYENTGVKDLSFDLDDFGGDGFDGTGF